MTDLSALIVALEGATGPSRELDLECWWWGKASQPGVPMEPAYKAHNLKMNDAPRYTSSVDAALTLVPDGSYGFAFPWFYSEYSKKERNCVVWRAAILKPIWEKATPSLAGDDWFERAETDDAATPALALCIAALKARQASSTPSDQSPVPQQHRTRKE